METCRRSYTLGRMSGDTSANVCPNLFLEKMSAPRAISASAVSAWRVAIVIFGGDVCTEIDQRQCNICTTSCTSQVQRRSSVVISAGYV